MGKAARVSSHWKYCSSNSKAGGLLSRFSPSYFSLNLSPFETVIDECGDHVGKIRAGIMRS